jgi:hypothetical protein
VVSFSVTCPNVSCRETPLTCCAVHAWTVCMYEDTHAPHRMDDLASIQRTFIGSLLLMAGSPTCRLLRPGCVSVGMSLYHGRPSSSIPNSPTSLLGRLLLIISGGGWGENCAVPEPKRCPLPRRTIRTRLLQRCQASTILVSTWGRLAESCPAGFFSAPHLQPRQLADLVE